MNKNDSLTLLDICVKFNSNRNHARNYHIHSDKEELGRNTRFNMLRPVQNGRPITITGKGLQGL